MRLWRTRGWRCWQHRQLAVVHHHQKRRGSWMLRRPESVTSADVMQATCRYHRYLSVSVLWHKNCRSGVLTTAGSRVRRWSMTSCWRQTSKIRIRAFAEQSLKLAIRSRWRWSTFSMCAVVVDSGPTWLPKIFRPLTQRASWAGTTVVLVSCRRRPVGVESVASTSCHAAMISDLDFDVRTVVSSR